MFHKFPPCPQCMSPPRSFQCLCLVARHIGVFELSGRPIKHELKATWWTPCVQQVVAVRSHQLIIHCYVTAMTAMQSCYLGGNA